MSANRPNILILDTTKLDSRYLLLSGGTLTGALSLSEIIGTPNVDIKIGSTTVLAISGTGALATNLRTSQNLYLPATSSSSIGVMYMNNVRYMHSYAPVGSNGNNLFFGPNAGNFTMAISGQVYHCQENLGIGNGALDALTTGYNNLAVGTNALGALTTGPYNIAIGSTAMGSATGATWGMGIGSNALASTSGSYNIGLGRYTLQYMTGSYNLAIGFDTARLIADGNNFTGGTRCTYIGTEVRASANSVTNEIAIGDQAIGVGSNTVVLGSSAITRTLLTGNVELRGNNTFFRGKRVDGTTAVSLMGVDTNNNSVCYIGDTSKHYLVKEPGGSDRFSVFSYGGVGFGQTLCSYQQGHINSVTEIATANSQSLYAGLIQQTVNVQAYTGLTGYGYKFDAPTKSGAGTIDNFFQLAIDPPTIGTNNYVARLGNATNNTTIESDGTVVFNGSATVFDDLLGDITQVKTLGTGVSIDTTESTIDFTTVANLSDYAMINYQMSHSWKAGSNIYPHIHWQQNSNAVPNFLIQYRWQKNGQAKTTAWTNYKANTTSVFTYVSGTLNQITYGAAITPPANYSISDIIQFRIIRDNANTSTVFAGADGYTGDAEITGVDIHFEQDTVGSRTEYAK